MYNDDSKKYLRESKISLKDAYSKFSIKIGVAINGASNDRTLISSPAMQEIMKKHFNITTFSNLMKPLFLLDHQKSIDNFNSGRDVPGVDFSIIDPCMQFCMENSIGMRGHVLIWHTQMPDWYFKKGYDENGELIDKSVLRNRMDSYFKQVIEYCESKYPGVVYTWDVVNEAVEQDGYGYEETYWYKIYGGIGYIADAFQIARKYASPSVKLFYNDYNTFEPLKTQKIIEIIKPIFEAGNLDGIGMQAYYNADYPEIRSGRDNIRDAILQFAKEGFEIDFTEFTVRVADVKNVTTDDYVKQAERYKEILNMILEIKKSGKANITSITFFGLMDEHYFHFTGEDVVNPGENEYTRLFDKYLKPKPAFYAVLEAAMENLE